MYREREKEGEGGRKGEEGRGRERERENPKRKRAQKFRELAISYRRYVSRYFWVYSRIQFYIDKHTSILNQCMNFSLLDYGIESKLI